MGTPEANTIGGGQKEKEAFVDYIFDQIIAFARRCKDLLPNSEILGTQIKPHIPLISIKTLLQDILQNNWILTEQDSNFLIQEYNQAITYGYSNTLNIILKGATNGNRLINKIWGKDIDNSRKTYLVILNHYNRESRLI